MRLVGWFERCSDDGSGWLRWLGVGRIVAGLLRERAAGGSIRPLVAVGGIGSRGAFRQAPPCPRRPRLPSPIPIAESNELKRSRRVYVYLGAARMQQGMLCVCCAYSQRQERDARRGREGRRARVAREGCRLSRSHQRSWATQCRRDARVPCNLLLSKNKVSAPVYSNNANTAPIFLAQQPPFCDARRRWYCPVTAVLVSDSYWCDGTLSSTRASQQRHRHHWKRHVHPTFLFTHPISALL